MSQEELALRSGYSQEYISMLEQGKFRKRSPRLDTIERIADALECCPLTLIGCRHCGGDSTQCRREDKNIQLKEG